MSTVLVSSRRLGEERVGRSVPWQRGLADIVRNVGRWGTVGTVAAAPWWFGSVELRAQYWLLLVSAVVAACCALAILTGRQKSDGMAEGGPVFSGALFPLVTALGLGFLQLVSLDRAAAAVVSPGAVALRDELASEENLSDQSLVAQSGVGVQSQRHTVSLCPSSTKLELAWLSLVAAFFVFGAWWFSSGPAQVVLWGVVAVNGAALAFFGLVQKLSYNGMIYWSVPLSQGGAPFGPFVNRNNAAGYLNLCLACALGLLVWALHRSGFLGVRAAVSHATPASAATVAPRQYSGRGFSLGLGEFLARFNGWTAVAVVAASFIFAGVVVSLSRGGILALGCATALTAVIGLASRRFNGRLVWTGIVVFAGLGLVGWVNAGESVRARLATLLERAALEEGRMAHWSDVFRAVPQFWRSGTGLGTYRYVNGVYHTRPSNVWFQHAENEYLEFLVEGGVVGLALWVAFLGLVGAASWRLLRGGSDSLAPVAGIVGLFALASQAAHALVDFGLRIPANSILFAAICGAVTAKAARESRRQDLAGRRSVPRADGAFGRWVPAGVVAVLAGVVLWGASQTAAAAKLETALKQVPVIEAWTDAAEGHLAQAIDGLGSAVDSAADDAVGHAALAKLWIGLYRAREFRWLQQAAPAGTRRETLWAQTAPQSLHGRAHRLARVRMDDALDRLRRGSAVQETLAVALRHLLLARRANPLLPDVHVLIAELSVLFADPGADELHVERARHLAAGDPELLYRCGVLDYQARRWDAALASWRQSLASSEKRLADILHWLGPELESAETMQKAFPPNPLLLIRLATNHFHAANRRQERDNALAYAAASVRRMAVPEAQRHYLSGAVLALQGRVAEAITEYSRALECNPGEIAWRFELASLLESQGRWEEARREARLCVVAEPNRIEYRDLLHRISMAEAGRPSAVPSGKSTMRQ